MSEENAAECETARPSLVELGFTPVTWDGWLQTLGENDRQILKLRRMAESENPNTARETIETA